MKRICSQCQHDHEGDYTEEFGPGEILCIWCIKGTYAEDPQGDYRKKGPI